MNNWVLFAIALVATGALLFATLAMQYPREPLFKPYWEDQKARQQILTNVTQIGIQVARGDRGVVIIGYRDMLNAPRRGELLAVLSRLIANARGYTVYLAPWADDNATRLYLSLLYSGKISAEQYLQGVVKNGTALHPNVDKALNLAKAIAQTYGSYRPLGAGSVANIPPIYAAIFRNDTSYVVYEPFTLGRDKNFSDWAAWVISAIEMLNRGQGRATP